MRFTSRQWPYNDKQRREFDIQDRVEAIAKELTALSAFAWKREGKRKPGKFTKPSKRLSKPGTADKCPDPNEALFSDVFPERRERMLKLGREWKALVEEYQSL